MQIDENGNKLLVGNFVDESVLTFMLLSPSPQKEVGISLRFIAKFISAHKVVADPENGIGAQ